MACGVLQVRPRLVDLTNASRSGLFGVDQLKKTYTAPVRGSTMGVSMVAASSVGIAAIVSGALQVWPPSVVRENRAGTWKLPSGLGVKWSQVAYATPGRAGSATTHSLSN